MAIVAKQKTIVRPKHTVNDSYPAPDFTSPAYGKQVDPFLATINKARMYLAMKIREHGKNRGKMVEHFQKTVDGKAEQEPWCAAFVCTILYEVSQDLEIDHLQFSEHCQTMWRKNKLYQRKDPQPGFISVWAVSGSSKGHVGICETGFDKDGFYYTVEGNTSGGGDSREGDGVYRVKRHRSAWKGYSLLGFIDPWIPKKSEG